MRTPEKNKALAPQAQLTTVTLDLASLEREIPGITAAIERQRAAVRQAKRDRKLRREINPGYHRSFPGAHDVRPDGGPSALVRAKSDVKPRPDGHGSDTSDGKPPRRAMGFSSVEVVRKEER